MRASQWYINTLKETPRDAEIISHQFMLRAGMIRKLASGLYTWLPLGLKVLRKVEHIVREEMNRAGGIEVLMPAVQPAELWQETGRWDTFGGQLLTMKDSQERLYCFGPTHEEVITDFVRHEICSYKQLPRLFYQIQTKFRDEIRPRFGVMRAREFLMKDAYSFHVDEQSLQETYQNMHEAYCRIFDRLGLQYRAVDADTGAIGGAVSHEFQVLADAGEDLIAYSDQSSYAANVEQASSLYPDLNTTPPRECLIDVATPGIKTIQEVSDFLKTPVRNIIKTLLVVGTETPYVAIALRGDDELNLIKAAKHPWIQSPVQFVEDKDLDLPLGFIGPVGLSIPVIADHQARAMSDFVCGANRADHHYQHVAWERDATCQAIADLRSVQEGDASPDGLGTLHLCRGIEVGHIFQLGDKYSKAMQALITHENGQAAPIIMGTYGIGISRIVAAAIEQHHDEKGIVWPLSMAPFELVIIPLHGAKSPLVRETAEALYAQCLAQGIDVLLDDRPERPGVLFADHDLIGTPHRLVISERLLQDGRIEYKARQASEVQTVPLEEIMVILNGLMYTGA